METVERKGSSHRPNRDLIVLVVDDEPGILSALRRSLRNEPVEVITAGSPAEALGWLDEIAVDLIITDQKMPGMIGTDLLREVRRRSPRTARALMTSDRAPSTVSEGLESGADTFIYKPWDEGQLVGRVRRILKIGDSNRPAPS
jgi:DNA-binding response OmpR family regulator